MPTRLLLKRGTAKTKSKATKAGQLALSPPESERQNSEVKSEAKSEVKEIMALIKESAGGTNLKCVRERRLSKDRPEGPTQPRQRRMSKEALEAAQINHLVQAAKEDMGVLRERRNSHEQAVADAKALRESRKSKMVVDLSDGSDSDRSRSSTDASPASTPVSPTVAEAAPAPALAPVSAPPLASPEEETEEQPWEQQLARLLQPISNPHLTGAAARGAQAAALSRVKAATAAVGGVFLTADEWDRTRSELAQLRFQNDRLTKALKESEKQNEKQNEKQLLISIAKENSSPNFLRKMASRIPAAPLTRASSSGGPNSPLWRMATASPQA